MTYEEKELFRRVSDGDEAAFELLFNAYLPRLVPFARKLTDDWDAAREIVQETFLRLWLSREKLSDLNNPDGYVFTVASHQCYKYLRRKATNSTLSDQLPEDAATTDNLGLQELNTLVRAAVASLSEQRRKVFLLSREKGLTINEIAATLELSPNTVKNTLVSALKLIREHLETRGYILPAFLLFFLAENF